MRTMERIRRLSTGRTRRSGRKDGGAEIGVRTEAEAWGEAEGLCAGYGGVDLEGEGVAMGARGRVWRTYGG